MPFTSGYRPRRGSINPLELPAPYPRELQRESENEAVWKPWEHGYPELEYGPDAGYYLREGEKLIPPERGVETTPLQIDPSAPIPRSRPYNTNAQEAASFNATGSTSNQLRQVLKEMVRERAMAKWAVPAYNLPERTRDDENNIIHALNFGAISPKEVATELDGASRFRYPTAEYPEHISAELLFTTQYPNHSAMIDEMVEPKYTSPMQSQGFLKDILNKIAIEQDAMQDDRKI